jgi:hypothetical protein
MPSLDGPNLKLKRAREHLHALDVEIDAFLHTDPRPFRGVREIDPDDGSHVWRLRIDRTPPDRMGVLIGDVVHNQRAALDHLVWQLALLTSESPRRSTQFPVYLDRLASRPGQRAFDPDGLRQIADIPVEAKRIIESKQPFTVSPGSDPRDTPLWFIHDLDIVDKHRLIPVLSPTTARITAIHPIPSDVPEAEIISHGGVLNQGDEILRVPAVIGARMKEDSEPRFVFDVALGVAGPVGTHPFGGCSTTSTKRSASFLLSSNRFSSSNPSRPTVPLQA